ncbi:MAG TPA: type II toxin-antitoxin system PemK/MazF family toxin [Spirochaetia bacterium]|nr:type II toxin-antitoxin system PemK/MazF family toxin [Spirochaetia bacterium]
MTAIKRGEIYLVDFTPSRGSEQAGYRPALVIQNDAGNKYGNTTIVAAVSTALGKVYPFLVRLAAGQGGLERESVVNLSQILTIDKGRLQRKLGALSHDKMAEVDKAVMVSLALY